MSVHETTVSWRGLDVRCRVEHERAYIPDGGAFGGDPETWNVEVLDASYADLDEWALYYFEDPATFLGAQGWPASRPVKGADVCAHVLAWVEAHQEEIADHALGEVAQ